jgi:DNA-binding response OmpR family regulator
MNAVAPTYEALLATVGELTDERDFYRRELGQMRDAEGAELMRGRLGLTPREADIVMVLHARRGRSVTYAGIMDAVYSERPEEPAEAIVKVFICKIRKKIGADKITTNWGTGVQLSVAGVALIDQALRVGQ